MRKTLEHLAFYSDSSAAQNNLPAGLDQQIRDLARQCRMPSSFLELDYQTEPSFFSALPAYGHRHDLVLIRPDGFLGLAGLGIRSSRRAYLAGAPTEVGYLHHLRFHPDIRGGSFLARGYKEFRRVFQQNPLRVTFTSILEDNHEARRLLEASRAGGNMPVYQPLTRFLTAMIPLVGPGQRWPRRQRSTLADKGLTSRCLDSADMPALLQLFAEWGKKHDGSPALQAADFTGSATSMLPGLKITDMIGLFAQGELVGAIGIWNQQAYRQIVLSHLCSGLAGLRSLWRLGSPLLGCCPIPETGGVVNFVLLDPWAVKVGFADDYMPLLLESGIREAQRRGALFAALGVAENNRVINAVKTVFFIPYWSIIYQVFWPETGLFDFAGRTMQVANLGAL